MSVQDGHWGLNRPRPARAVAAGYNPFWIYLFLFPVFFQRIFIGGEGTVASYDELTGASTVLLGYGAHLLICLRYLLEPSNFQKDPLFGNVFLPLFLVSALHMLLLFAEPFGANQAVLGILRSLFWILACVAIVRYSTPEDFLKAVINLIHVTFIVIVVSSVAYRITGIPYQIIMFGDVPRAQGFLTEPSGAATLLAGYVAHAIFVRKYWRIVPAIIAVALINSVIAYTGFIAAFAFGGISLLVASPANRVLLRRIILYSIPVSFVFLALASGPISSFATELRASISMTSFGDTMLYRGVIDRLLQAMSVLQTGIDLVRAGGNVTEGGLFRYTSILLLMDDLAHSWRGLTGYGLGAHAQLMAAKEMSLLDFGLLPLAFSSFGLPLGFLLFAFMANFMSRSEHPIAIFGTPCLFIGLFNSAGGIHGYSLAIVAALFLVKLASVRKNAQIRR
ncbi:hypothetical protein BrevBR_05095 [Brevundimonas sp. BR2-1]|uniref:hypothetical protein n=1 Tax=Brevundimonas sp. BR2-1 TaxID=3031123 RepID=UPI0030990A03